MHKPSCFYAKNKSIVKTLGQSIILLRWEINFIAYWDVSAQLLYTAAGVIDSISNFKCASWWWQKLQGCLHNASMPKLVWLDQELEDSNK